MITDPTITALAASVDAEAPFVPDLTLRIAKNTREMVLNAEEIRWCGAAHVHLATHPQAAITVAGHTDGDGEAVLNQRLSLQRAKAVRATLIELGIPAERIEAVGMGAAEPIADNLTSKGKALNRRVEIHISDRP